MLIALSLFLTIAPAGEIVVDTSTTVAISPYIYGANNPDWAKIKDVPFTFARQGGNRMTAFNWETNASNAGNDWHFQNDGYMGESDEPGRTPREFLQSNEVHTGAVLLTVPTLGYVSADKKGDGDVSQTPGYLNVRFNRSLAKKPGPFAYPPDIHDKVVYQDEFVHWIETQKKPATRLWFSLDNEPDLWASTHEKIHPNKATYAEIITNNQEYAAAIKAAAPSALVFGPANYGWEGFRHFQGAPDANGRDFLDAYLSAMKTAQDKNHKRLIDVLDVHWYPEAQGDKVRITEEGTAGTAAARIQAPRSLWDPTYVEQSWITASLGNKPIALIPGIQAQITRQYPGTKFSITEYNYGGGKVISGALAQADVLGIFGRYGLFAAANWGIGANDPAQLAGFRAFLNFDGHGARFGNLSARVAGETPEANSVYVARDDQNPKRLTVVALNKSATDQPFSIKLDGFAPSKARGFRIDKDHLDAAVATPVSVTGPRLQFHLPPESVISIEVLE